jgi:hypothetical protein
MPEQPSVHALDIITTAGERACEAGKLAAEAAELLGAGPLDTASAFLAMALLENRAALDRMKVSAAEWEALWDEGFAAGRALERAAADDGCGRAGGAMGPLARRGRKPAGNPLASR